MGVLHKEEFIREHYSDSMQCVLDFRRQTLSFKKKAELFYAKIGAVDVYGRRQIINVKRHDIIQSTKSTLSRFKAADFKKRPNVKFEGEDGIDAGGLSRYVLQ